MKNRLTIILLLLSVVTIAKAQLPYREKYAAVLDHYRNDSLKYAAALFLIDNMDGHITPCGKTLDDYIISIRTSQSDVENLWEKYSADDDTHYVCDSAIVDDAFLISEIDGAFSSWFKAPWHRQVSFRRFCKYILPYRVADERLDKEWRTFMYEKFHSFADGITDVRKAYTVVSDSIKKLIELSKEYSPYTLDPVSCQQVGRAGCRQRCITIAAILRALAIPATIDEVPVWADYSTSGHTWLTMILDNGEARNIYNLRDGKKILKPIDASSLDPKYTIKAKDHCPYAVKRGKRTSKVYRHEYEKQIPQGKPKALVISRFERDVSREYGLTDSLLFEVTTNDTVLLCTFRSGGDWVAVDWSVPRNGKVVFRNLGDSIVYLPIIERSNMRMTISVPVLLEHNEVTSRFLPQKDNLQTICIDRKYPLCSNVTDAWGGMIKGVFEGADDSDFTNPDTLAVIKTMPHGWTRLLSKSDKPHRYLRYHSPKKFRSAMAEIRFLSVDQFGNKEILKGNILSYGLDKKKVGQVFDNNVSTVCKASKTGYYIGIDLGEGISRKVTEIEFYPTTDLNFVEKGHLYELYYFDTKWQLAGRAFAGHETLEFKGMPTNALFLLRDKSGGHEERIFEYKDGMQIWH